MSWMRQEIGEQPAAVARVLEAEGGKVDALAAAARERGIELLFLAARGRFRRRGFSNRSWRSATPSLSNLPCHPSSNSQTRP